MLILGLVRFRDVKPYEVVASLCDLRGPSASRIRLPIWVRWIDDGEIELMDLGSAKMAYQVSCRGWKVMLHCKSSVEARVGDTPISIGIPVMCGTSSICTPMVDSSNLNWSGVTASLRPALSFITQERKVLVRLKWSRW